MQRTMSDRVDIVLIPIISLFLAFSISALIIAGIGEDPFEAAALMVSGALGSAYGWGYTLYYATNFIFVGLAFAVAFHARLFNIGGEGQAMLGALGTALVALHIPWPHWSLALLGCGIGAALFGAFWALIPAWMQARRGSHIVITTIMFNFIAAALLNYLLVNHLRPEGSVAPGSALFPDAVHLPTLHDILSPLGFAFSKSTPANITAFLSVAAAILLWFFLWRTRTGYEIRTFGHSENAARYAGIDPFRITLIAMGLSGALAGLMALNATMGESERLILNPTEGAGFIGIAVALMGRCHPLGIVLASILFGFLYQGGAELALWTSIPRELIVVIQALVILFTGALDNMVRMPIERLLARSKRARSKA
ncbi:ABC transporter permease [Thioalkalivibrio sp. HK1]|uniref:ABC transporter permease n=1 Tax=Thioalkalivibrio sp. HK1 TaxID=1469245 RepID=UPI0018CC3621|nr:ABC transporter permease [Thioalkalivibrio sp. HK1]